MAKAVLGAVAIVAILMLQLLLPSSSVKLPSYCLYRAAAHVLRTISIENKIFCTTQTKVNIIMIIIIIIRIVVIVGIGCVQ